MKLSLGVLAFVVGSAIAVVGLGVYQAWWTIVFPIGGAIAATLERRGIPAIETIVLSAATAVCLALGGLGAFLMAMSGRGCARPDLPCPAGPPDLLFVGAGALVASAVVLGAVVALVRRRLRMRPTASEGGSPDIRQR